MKLTVERAIGFAIVALLLVLAMNSMPQSDPSPGWHTVVPCPQEPGSEYYDASPNNWCDDPNTTD